MDNIVLTSFIISLIFFLAKFIEMRFIIKENKPLKQLTIDSLIVFISSTATIMILDQFNIGQIIGNSKPVLSAFVNNPDF
jgi:hypothetical protein